jgi:hypothetical protein
MHKTFASGGTETAWTISMWVKRGALGSDQRVFSCDDSSDGDPDNYWRFKSDDTLQVNIYNGSTIGNLVTNRKFRDCSSWYHICVIWKSGDSTSTDRLQLWVNGTRETSFSATTFPSQDAATVTSSQVVAIGRRNYGPQQYFDGYLAEVVFLDGVTASPVDTLGEFDEDTPTIFKPKDPSGLSFGTNGFYLDFEDSSNLGNDKNGGTDFTEVNLAATDQTTDTCTNNFATLNPLVTINGSTFSEGNSKVATGSSPYSYDVSTIGVANGKWYVEAKYGGSSDDATFGIAGRTATDTTHELGHYNDTWSYYTGTGASNVRNNNSNSSYGNTYAANDIIGLALDLTNNKLYFSKNGTWQNSGDPTSGSTGTGAVSITAASSVTDGVYYIGIGDLDGGASVTWEINFGNPSFSISSGNADANGYGNFEYAVPSGYYSLNTKNLAEFG